MYYFPAFTEQFSKKAHRGYTHTFKTIFDFGVCDRPQGVGTASGHINL